MKLGFHGIASGASAVIGSLRRVLEVPMRWRFWIFVSAAAVAGALLAEVGAARLPQPALPGTCDKGITPFCADPAWPK